MICKRAVKIVSFHIKESMHISLQLKTEHPQCLLQLNCHCKPGVGMHLSQAPRLTDEGDPGTGFWAVRQELMNPEGHSKFRKLKRKKTRTFIVHDRAGKEATSYFVISRSPINSSQKKGQFHHLQLYACVNTALSCSKVKHQSLRAE